MLNTPLVKLWIFARQKQKVTRSSNATRALPTRCELRHKILLAQVDARWPIGRIPGRAGFGNQAAREVSKKLCWRRFDRALHTICSLLPEVRLLEPAVAEAEQEIALLVMPKTVQSESAM